LRAGVRAGDAPWRPEAFGPERAPRAEWILVLVKAPETRTAALAAARMQPRGVLSLQNGLVDDVLREALPGVLAGQGVTTEGAYREGDCVVPAGAGETLCPPGFEPLAARLRDAGFDARVEPRIAAARLAKFVVNLAINPLTAAYRVPNGAVAEPPLAAIARALVEEAVPVLRPDGLELDAPAALARVLAVARATAANRSSMLQDVLAGRPTELEALTGELLRRAARRGMAVPAHLKLYRELKIG
jgi:2-dehydropantoate 2-reductase